LERGRSVLGLCRQIGKRLMRKDQIGILVADDDPDMLDSIGAMLKEAGYTDVTCCSKSADVMQRVAERPVHLALIDLRLGNEDGLKLIEQIQEQNRQVAVVIITAFPSMETATEGMKLGTSDYLTKPITSENLVAAVEKALARKGIFPSSESNLNVILGRRLRMLRQRANLTTQQLADRVGVSQSQISQIETGRSAASVTTLYRIANALDLTLSELVENV